MAFDGKARIAAAEAKIALAKAKLSEEDLAEIDARAEAAAAEASAATIEKAARDLDLARRLDAAKAALPDGAHVRELAIKEHVDTFVITDPGTLAYRAYMKKLNAAGKKNAEMIESAHLEYAKASVYDWNGATDWNAIVVEGDTKNTNGVRLGAFLRATPAIALTIANAAAELAGFAAEERKSEG